MSIKSKVICPSDHSPSLELSINARLNEIYQTAKEIHDVSIVNGVVDLSDTESLFCAMQNLAQSAHIPGRVSSEYADLYNLCMLTLGVEEFSEIENVDGLPNDYRELAQAAVASCPIIEAFDSVKVGLSQIHHGTKHMNSQDREKFVYELSQLLTNYDIIGECAVNEIFSNQN